MEPPYEGFQISWQKRREEIGKYIGESFDSQETNICALTSNCEEIEDDDLQEGDYAFDEAVR